MSKIVCLMTLKPFLQCFCYFTGMKYFLQSVSALMGTFSTREILHIKINRGLLVFFFKISLSMSEHIPHVKDLVSFFCCRDNNKTQDMLFLNQEEVYRC